MYCLSTAKFPPYPIVRTYVQYIVFFGKSKNPSMTRTKIRRNIMGTKNITSEEAVSRTVGTRNDAARAMSARKTSRAKFQAARGRSVPEQSTQSRAGCSGTLLGTKNTASEEAVSRTVETRNAAARAMSARKTSRAKSKAARGRSVPEQSTQSRAGCSGTLLSRGSPRGAVP